MSNNPFVKDHSISVGYNNTGQDFFDLLNNYRNYIHSYFFSMKETMKGSALDPEEVFATLKAADTYGIPGNILFNSRHADTNNWEYWIDKIVNDVELSSATVMSVTEAEAIKKKYPWMELHLSVRYYDWGYGDNMLQQLPDMVGKIDVINISGRNCFNDLPLIQACHDVGIKTKFIVNEGCITHQMNNYRNFPAFRNGTCNGHPCPRTCDDVVKMYPWMMLTRINLFKEAVQYFGYDILKISARSISLDATKWMLDYWASPRRTDYAYDIKITDKNYHTFVDYVRTRITCSNDCYHCRKCEKFYDDLINNR